MRFNLAKTAVLSIALFIGSFLLVQPAQARPAVHHAPGVAANVVVDANGWPKYWWDCKLSQYWISPVAGRYVDCLPGIPQWQWAPHEADFFAVRAWQQRGQLYGNPFDCSLLVQWAAQNAYPPRYLPRTTWQQLSTMAGSWKPPLRRGDVVWFYGGEHIGIFLGTVGSHTWIIHAPTWGQVITVEDMYNMPIAGFGRPFNY